MKPIAFIIITSVFLFSCGGDKEPSNTVSQAASQKPVDEVQKNDTTQLKKDTVKVVALTVNTQTIEGDLGQITFSQKEKTIFYYDQKTKKGKVVLNNIEYTINKFSFDSKSNSYQLSGDKVNIDASNCKYKKQNGEDCSYGTFANVSIMQGTSVLLLQNVAVQDCPAY
jgi:hypothetical protein